VPPCPTKRQAAAQDDHCDDDDDDDDAGQRPAKKQRKKTSKVPKLQKKSATSGPLKHLAMLRGLAAAQKASRAKQVPETKTTSKNQQVSETETASKYSDIMKQYLNSHSRMEWLASAERLSLVGCMSRSEIVRRKFQLLRPDLFPAA
jgi:hypothetical protein